MRCVRSTSDQSVLEAAARTGRTRIVLSDQSGRPVGLVHVRDAYLARSRGERTPAGELAHPVPDLSLDTPVTMAVSKLRADHSQLGIVRNADGTVAGLISLDDLLATLLTPA